MPRTASDTSLSGDIGKSYSINPSIAHHITGVRRCFFAPVRASCPTRAQSFKVLPGDTLIYMDIDAVIAALGTRFDPAEAAIAERMLREYAGSIPDAQLVEAGWRWRSGGEAGADLA